MALSVLDLPSILYNNPKQLSPLSNDSFGYGLGGDMYVYIKKQESGVWNVSVSERGAECSKQTIDSEYLACLKLLRIAGKIATDEPESMKVIDTDTCSWFLFERSGQFYLDARCDINSHVDVSWHGLLIQEELDLYRELGRNFLTELANEISNSNPFQPKAWSKFTSRHISDFKSEGAVQAWRKIHPWANSISTAIKSSCNTAATKTIKVYREACCGADDQSGDLEREFDTDANTTLKDLAVLVQSAHFLQFTSSHSKITGHNDSGIPLVDIFSNGELKFYSDPDELLTSALSSGVLNFEFPKPKFIESPIHFHESVTKKGIKWGRLLLITFVVVYVLVVLHLIKNPL